jgi:putative membrane protein
MRYVHVAVLILFATVVLIFGFQNTKSVSVFFLSWNATLPLFVLVICTYLLGMVSGGSLAAFLRRSMLAARKQSKPAGSDRRPEASGKVDR